MAKIQNTDSTTSWQGCRVTGTLIHCWWKCKMVQPLWKIIWQFLTKQNLRLSYNPAVTLLNTYPNELKIYAHTKNPHTNVNSTFVHNYQELEEIKISFSKKVDK